MALYAIGDLQGCIAPLERLLEDIAFDPVRDRLWFVGDLVNRGPDSVACLRFVKGLGERAVTVLGNHDLHLVAVGCGVAKGKSRDTLGDVLRAPDRDELLDWLRHRPLLHAEEPFALVHAGLLPEWDLDQSLALAAEVEARLRASDYVALLSHMYGDEPSRWDDRLEGFDRLRIVINAMTRLRVCDGSGAMVLAFKGEPDEVADPRALPWFDVPGRRTRDRTIVCGHWSALGLRIRDDLLALDSGCVWGRQLSAVRLDDRRVFQVACRGPAG